MIDNIHLTVYFHNVVSARIGEVELPAVPRKESTVFGLFELAEYAERTIAHCLPYLIARRQRAVRIREIILSVVFDHDGTFVDIRILLIRTGRRSLHVHISAQGKQLHRIVLDVGKRFSAFDPGKVTAVCIARFTEHEVQIARAVVVNERIRVDVGKIAAVIVVFIQFVVLNDFFQFHHTRGVLCRIEIHHICPIFVARYLLALFILIAFRTVLSAHIHKIERAVRVVGNEQIQESRHIFHFGIAHIGRCRHEHIIFAAVFNDFGRIHFGTEQTARLDIIRKDGTDELPIRKVAAAVRYRRICFDGGEGAVEIEISVIVPLRIVHIQNGRVGNGQVAVVAAEQFLVVPRGIAVVFGRIIIRDRIVRRLFAASCNAHCHQQ